MTESGSASNPILQQPLEVRLFLESKMKDDLTNKEILEIFLTKFTWIKGITSRHIASYRNRYVPNYKQVLLQRYGREREKPESEIEEEILQEVREAELSGDEFNKKEQQKINMLRAHRAILKELWNNYRSVKDTKDETAKKNYLEGLVKVLSAVRELESSEQSFLSAIDECRKAELKLTPENYIDSLCGWFIPRCMDKCKDKDQASKVIDLLKMYLDDYKKVLDSSKDIAEANKEILQKLYVSNKAKENEKEENENG